MSYFDLGAYSRPVTTSSAEAQTWFDRGLNWTYGYNQEEGVACFRKALEHDPHCAMAWWGIAFANGPFYNRPWIRFTRPEVEETLSACHEAASRAVALITSRAFEVLALRKLTAGVYHWNRASMRVLEKNGYHLERVETHAFVHFGEWVDQHHYALRCPARRPG